MNANQRKNKEALLTHRDTASCLHQVTLNVNITRMRLFVTHFLKLPGKLHCQAGLQCDQHRQLNAKNASTPRASVTS